MTNSSTELSDMAGSKESLRRRGSFDHEPHPHLDDNDDDTKKLLSKQDRLGSFSKEPKKANADVSSVCSRQTACIALTVIVGGLFMVIGTRKQGESRGRNSEIPYFKDFG